MKIGLLIPSLEAGGAERQLVQLANGLAARGHEIHVALFRVSGPLVADLDAGVRLHDLRKGGKGDVLGFLWRTLRLFRELRVDVLYSFLGVPNLVAAALKPFLAKTLVVWSVRASDMELSRYSLLSRVCWRVECFLSTVPDCVVANSAAGLEFARSQGYSHRTDRVIFNGINTDRFAPNRERGESLRAEIGCGSSDVVFGMVARLDPMKDHATFLKAAEIVARQDKNVRFACAGDGPLGEELRCQGESLGLGDVLTWLGERTDIETVYNALDVCCLSSAFGEGFPNVLGEAMSCGVPCVATDVGDAAHIVGDTGMVVPAGDAEAFARAILDMSKRVREGKGFETRSRVVELFSLNRMVENTERLLAEVAR